MQLADSLSSKARNHRAAAQAQARGTEKDQYAHHNCGDNNYSLNRSGHGNKPDEQPGHQSDQCEPHEQ